MTGRRFFGSTIKQVSATAPFTFTINTANTSAGSTTNTQFKLPLVSIGTYDFTVDWGDSSSDNITVWNQAETTHTYGSTGTYTITILGDCRGFAFNNSGDRLKITDISNFGSLKFTEPSWFFGCSNLNISATDIPDLSLINSISQIFRGCISLVFNDSINSWDISNATVATRTFDGALIFNQPIGNWNVSNVTDMAFMFNNARAFNQPIGNWNVSNVTSMQRMFQSTAFRGGVFNQDISSWDVSNVTDISFMFESTRFNQDISSWNVGNVQQMQGLFRYVFEFNQPIGIWDVSSATSMSQMFQSSSNFNQDISDWNVVSLVSASQFMVGKTNENYDASKLDAIYNKWSLLALNPNVTIGFGTIKYTAAGSAGRAILTGAPNNWTITDGGI